METEVVRRVVCGEEYRSDCAALVASTAEAAAQGRKEKNPEIRLYRSGKGRYFVVYRPLKEPAETRRLVPLNREGALRLYRSLPVHYWDEQKAFMNYWAGE